MVRKVNAKGKTSCKLQEGRVLTGKREKEGTQNREGSNVRDIVLLIKLEVLTFNDG